MIPICIHGEDVMLIIFDVLELILLEIGLVPKPEYARQICKLQYG